MFAKFAHWTYYNSPIGWISISGNGGSIAEISFMDEAPTKFYNPVPDYLQACVQQLDEYFKGTRKTFDLALDMRKGTEFQQQVWNELLKIPYGQTASYQKIAEKIQNPRAVRAVGAANGQNPLVLVVPCHRVIGANGDLVGFGGGMHRKKFLLALENPEQFGLQTPLF
jgi:methylated-DNA-[protein]-cysteine S-methyltransferase